MKAIFILLTLNLSFIGQANSQFSNEQAPETCPRESLLNPLIKQLDTKVNQLRDLQSVLQNQDLSDDERKAKKAEFAQKVDEANKLHQALNEHIVNAQNGVMPEIAPDFSSAPKVSIGESRSCAPYIETSKPICSIETCPLPIEENSWLYQHSRIDIGLELFNALTLLVTHNRFQLTHDKFIGVRPYANALMLSLTLGRLASYFTGAREYFSYFCYASSALMFTSGTASAHAMWTSIRARLPLPVWMLSTEERAKMLAVLTARILEGPGTLMETACSICRDDYVLDVAISHLACGHGFHTGCLIQWAQTLPRHLCPLCRKQ